jgi:hypothetical protein
MSAQSIAQKPSSSVDDDGLVPAELIAGFNIVSKKGGVILEDTTDTFNKTNPPKATENWAGIWLGKRLLIKPKSPAAVKMHLEYHTSVWMKANRDLPFASAEKLYHCNLPCKWELAELAAEGLADRYFVQACKSFTPTSSRGAYGAWYERWESQVEEIMTDIEKVGKRLALIAIVTECSTFK